jgi:tetratricopeptide (TPR) repeat protein
MSTFASLLAEGIFRYSAEDYEGSIEFYNALIICLNRRSLQKDNCRAKSTTVGGDVTTKDDHDSAEIKVILFRALSRRSEAYLAQSKYKNAYTNITTALMLYPHFDNGDDFTTSESGLLPSEIELVRDLMNHIFAGNL